MSPIIYRIFNKETNESYIGQTYNTLEQRVARHKTKAFRKGCNTKLARAIRELGSFTFSYEIVEEISSLDFKTPQELQDYIDSRELFWMSQYDSIENGYNTNDFCQGYRNPSPLLDSKITKEEFKHLFLDENVNREEIRKKLKISKGHFHRLCKQWGLGKSSAIIGKTSALTKMKTHYSPEQVEQFTNLFSQGVKLKDIAKAMQISYCSSIRLRDYLKLHRSKQEADNATINE